MEGAENFDELLRGDHIQNSPYVFRMLEPKTCNVVCRVELDAKTIDEFKVMIDNDYQVNMMLNDLPLARPLSTPTLEHAWVYDDAHRPEYRFGFPVGYTSQYAGSEDKRYYINNHLMFMVKYHQHPLTEKPQIVGFKVKPFSVEHEYEGLWNETTHLTTCDSHLRGAGVFKGSRNLQSVEKYKQVVFTYNVEFQETIVEWEARWYAYSLRKDDVTDWFSVMCSLLVLVFFSAMILIILLRTVSVDRREALSETGWNYS